MSIPVTRHFSVGEFACRDGSAYPVAELDEDGRTWLETRLLPLCETLEAIREAAGATPLTVNSGYRSPAYNAKLSGSAKDSQHPKGRAADIVHRTMRPLALFSLILALYEDGKLPHLGGVGLYPNFVHVDVRPRVGGHLAVWGGKRPSNIA